VNLTAWLLLACLLAFLTKLAGHLVPSERLEGAKMRRVTGLLPVALLSSLVVVQTFGGAGGALVVDARLAAVGVGIVALLMRAPFILVVALAAAVAAGLRALGWG